MSVFAVEAVSTSGALRVIEVSALTAEAAGEQARAQGLTPLKIGEIGLSKTTPREYRTKGLSMKELVSFCRTMSISLKAGGNSFSDCLMDYVGVLGETTSEGVALKRAAQRILDGEEPDAALMETGLFTRAFCNAVKSAQKVGYGNALAALAERYKTKLAFQRKIIKSATVPLIVLAITFTIAVVFFCVFVPMLEKMSRDMGTTPNAFSRAFLIFAHFFQTTWWIGALGLAGVVWMLIFNTAFRHTMIYLLMGRFRFIRNAVMSVRQLDVISTLWALKRSDVDLAECLREAGNVVAGTGMEKEMQLAAKSLDDGVSLSVALHNHTSLDTRIVRMVGATQDSNLTEQLGYIADIYREESEDRLEGLSTLLNVLFVSIAGLILGVLFIAVYAFFLSLATGITVSSGGLR